MILNASTVYPNLPVTVPIPSLVTFLDIMTSGQARNHLKYELQNNFDLNFEQSQAFVTALHAVYLLWDRRDCPSNFSVFFCRRSPAFAATSQESLILHMSSTEGGGLLEARITKSLKHPRSLLVDGMQADEQIQSLHGALANMIGERSPAAKNIKSWIPHMFTYISVYESRVEVERDLLAMILFIIDLAVQTHLQSCLVCEDTSAIDVVCLNFSAAQAVVLNYTLFVNLPEFLRVKAKGPREELASRSIMSDIISVPAAPNRAANR
jgi:hypothetical protein